ncbi:MAG: hypothetical protein HC831_03680 [Chloroflexia bacterium]|nr:hypothetical protein [Chloroflexia bacterium]
MSFLLISKREKRWLNYGKYRRSKYLTINQHKYYLEEVIFENYHYAIHNYYKIVGDIAAYDEPEEVKYDLYDWSFSIYRFKDTTIKLTRCIDKVHLVKSLTPVSIEVMELDNPRLKL